MVTRREALAAGLTAVGAAAVAACTEGRGAKSEAGMATPASKARLPIICLEEHVHDTAVAAAIREPFMKSVPYMAGLGTRYREDLSGYPADRPRLTFVPDSMRTAAAPMEDRLQAMNAADIDMQVLSLSNATQLAPKRDALDIARTANDRMAEIVRAYPTRFSAFFTLPWQDPDACVEEAERCVAKLGLPATLLGGRPAPDAFIDHPRYEPVLASLERLGVPLFLHPGPPLESIRQPYYTGFNLEVEARFSLFGWGWHHEAGIHVVRLILSGLLDRYPGLKIHSGHWGEMVPFFLGRLDDTMPPDVTGLSRTISQTYRDQVWVGPSGMLDRAHFEFVRDVVGMDRIVFSIDYPYLTLSGARAWLEGLGLSQSDAEKFAFRNAQALLGNSIQP